MGIKNDLKKNILYKKNTLKIKNLKKYNCKSVKSILYRNIIFSFSNAINTFYNLYYDS